MYLVFSIQVFAISFVFYLVGWSFDSLILVFQTKISSNRGIQFQKLA